MGLRPPRGVLLHGAPGSGKTLLARALAGEAGASFIAVRGAELLSPWQGSSERALRQLFARAREARPCILFFDEMDAIATRRGGDAGPTIERLVATLLTEMDGIADPPGLVVLGATNRVDRIDPALLRPGRFDLVVQMPVPDQAARHAILALHARRMPLAPDVNLEALASQTEGWNGADLAGLCRRAALLSLEAADDIAMAHVTSADFAAALIAARQEDTWRKS